MSWVQTSKQFTSELASVPKRSRANKTSVYYSGDLLNFLIQYMLGLHTYECQPAENLVHRPGCLSNHFLVLKAARVPGEPLVLTPCSKARKSGLQRQWRMTDPLTIPEQKRSSDCSSVLLQSSLYLGNCQKVLSTLPGTLPLSQLILPGTTVRLVKRRVFSLIPKPIKLMTKTNSITPRNTLRALSTLFLGTVSISFFWILIITPWVCGEMTSKILIGPERWFSG